jgi:hypothetical protein
MSRLASFPALCSLEELKQIGWGRVDLASRAEGVSEKVAIAARLRKETTMTVQWIATRLNMGTWTLVSNLLSAKGKTPSAWIVSKVR